MLTCLLHCPWLFGLQCSSPHSECPEAVCISPIHCRKGPFAISEAHLSRTCYGYWCHAECQWGSSAKLMWNLVLNPRVEEFVSVSVLDDELTESATWTWNWVKGDSSWRAEDYICVSTWSSNSLCREYSALFSRAHQAWCLGQCSNHLWHIPLLQHLGRSHLADNSLLLALRIVRQLPNVIAPPPSAKIVTNKGKDGVMSPSCCSVPLPVKNSTCTI